MDLQMPEMDGYQATAKLRSDARFATLPIIAMTAHATIEEKQRCLAAGMNDHISKPIDPANLFETVGRFYKSGENANVESGEHTRPRVSRPAPSPVGASGQPDVSRPSAAPKVADEAGALPIPLIGGLDTKDGLSRVGGNQKLYLKILRQFVGATSFRRRTDQRSARARRHGVGRASRAHAQGRGGKHRREGDPIGCWCVGETHPRQSHSLLKWKSRSSNYPWRLPRSLRNYKNHSVRLPKPRFNQVLRQQSILHSHAKQQRSCSNCSENLIPPRGISSKRTKLHCERSSPVALGPILNSLCRTTPSADAQAQLENTLKNFPS